jgi:hypothetical protein
MSKTSETEYNSRGQVRTSIADKKDTRDSRDSRSRHQAQSNQKADEKSKSRIAREKLSRSVDQISHSEYEPQDKHKT